MKMTYAKPVDFICAGCRAGCRCHIQHWVVHCSWAIAKFSAAHLGHSLLAPVFRLLALMFHDTVIPLALRCCKCLQLCLWSNSMSLRAAMWGVAQLEIEGRLCRASELTNRRAVEKTVIGENNATTLYQMLFKCPRIPMCTAHGQGGKPGSYFFSRAREQARLDVHKILTWWCV